MNARVFLLAAALLGFGATAADAGIGSVGFRAGLSTPAGDLARGVGRGFHYGISWCVADSGRWIGLDATHHSFSEKSGSEVAFLFPIGIRQKAQMFEVLANVRLLVGPEGIPAAPYLKFGFGVDYWKSDVELTVLDSSGRLSASAWWPVVAGGLGLTVPAGAGYEVGIEGLFQHLMDGSKPPSLLSATLAIRGKSRR